MKTRAIVLIAALAMSPLPAFAQQQSQALVTQHRTDVALRIVTRLMAQYGAGTATIDEVGMWIVRWYNAKRDGLTSVALVSVAQEYVDKMRTLEQLAKAHVQAGVASIVDGDKAEYYRVEAEATLAKVKSP